MKNIYTLLVAFFSFIIIPVNIFGEGSDEIWVDAPGNETKLYLCSDFDTQCGGNGVRTQFAIYDCAETDRLNFVVDNSDEIVYMGFDGAPGGFGGNVIVLRIKNSAGDIVFSEIEMPQSGTGFINSIDEARQGPQQITGAGGYDAIEFVPPGPDTYYIEFDRLGSNGERNPGLFEIELFDITVYDNNVGEIRNGRLYSKGWQFLEGQAGFNWLTNSATFYVYSNDSIITSVQFDEMEGRAWIMFCNQIGCANTGDFTEDRKSLFEEQAYVPEYPIFVNEPDPVIFPPATSLGQIIGTPTGFAYCDGHIDFSVEVDKAGNAEVILDFEGPYADRTLAEIVEAGVNIIPWDGLDDNGVLVPNGTPIDFTVSYINGLTNLPLYDVEQNNNGFFVELHNPPAPDPPLVFWDDSNLPPPDNSTNFTGCQSPPGCHSFSDGDLHTVNTWWYTASYTTVAVEIEEERSPDSLLFDQAPNQEYCGGQNNVIFSVDNDPNTDTIYWNFTGNDATITYIDPLTISVDFGESVTPGNIVAQGYNDNCGFGVESPLPINVNSYPDVDLGPDQTVCDNGINTGFFDAGPADTYLWNTGATTQVITPGTSGEYWVEAANGVCATLDTVLLTMVPEPITFAGSDTGICQYEILDFGGLDAQPEALEVDSILWFGGAGTFDDPRTIWPVYTPDPNVLGNHVLGLIGYGVSPCGNDTSYISIQIDTVPAGTITSIPVDTACVNEVVSFSGSSSNNVEFWEWDFGDGSPLENGQNITHAFESDGTYEVILNMYNEFMCLGQDTFYIVVQAIEVDIDASPSPACINEAISFSGIGEPVTFTDYQWDFGDGNTDIGPSVSHTYTEAGVYNVQLIVCSDTNYFDLTVYPPAISDAGSNESICEGQPFDFSTSSVQPDTTDAVSLQWYGGTGSFSEPTVLWPVYTPGPGEEGPVPLYMIAYSNVPCADDTTFMILTLDSLPEPSYTYLPATGICVNEAIQFSGQNDNTTTVSSWSWDFGDGGSSSAQNPLYSFSTSGTYDVTLILTNGEGCVDSITQQVTVHPLPEPAIAVIPASDTICAEIPFTFNGSSTTTITDWQWDFGDGVGSATGQNVSYTYNAAGDYTVRLIVINDNSCSDTVFRNVRVNALPQANFTNSPQDTTCTDDMISFSAFEISGGISDWQWQFGDGNTSSGMNTTHTYANQGDYTVLLIYSNGDGCLDTASKTIRIEELDVDFTRSPSPSCQGYMVTFQGIDYNGNAGFAQWEWDFGDGSPLAFGQNVAHFYPNPDDYDVTLTVCSETVVRTITVNPQVAVNSGGDQATCEDVAFDFSESTTPPSASSYSSVFWYGGAGIFDNPNDIQPVYTPGANELGSITLTMVGYGIAPCENDTSTMTLQVIEGAYAFAGSDENGCFGEAFDFSTSSSPPFATNWDTLYWTGGTGSFVDPNVPQPIYIPGPGEIGPVQLTMVASGFIVNCDSLDEMILNIRPDYLTDLYPEICYGDSLFAQDAWRYSSGTFYDTLQSVFFCDSVIETNLTVYPKIDKDFVISSGDSSCLEEVIQFTQTGSANLTNWLWDFGDGNTSSDQNPQHEYLNPGLYTIWFYYDDDMGCNDSVSHNLRVFDLPDVDFFSTQTSACTFTQIDFTGTTTSNIVSWHWNMGDGTEFFSQNVSYSYGIPGSYLVTLTVEDINGCTETAFHTIYVVTPPEADFGYEVAACHDIQFSDSSTSPPGYNLVEWSWDFDDGETSDLQNPLHTFPMGGTYNVTLIVTADSSGFFCYDSITKPVVVPNLPTIYYTFTPQPTCLGDSTYFFGATGNYITDWFWDFDDGYFSSEQYPVHLYADTGTYNVLLQITDTNLCQSTLVKQVRVTDVPDVSFTMSQSQACGDEMIYFEGQSSAPVAQWHWDFGDGSFSSLQNPQHAYVTRGTFTVTLTVTDTAGCQSDSSAQIMVVPKPEADFTYTNFECQTISFTDLSTPPAGGYNLVGWLWDFEDGFTSNAQNPLHEFPSGGTYNVSLVVTSDSSGYMCTDTAWQMVTVPNAPSVYFTWDPEPTTLGDETNFYGTSGNSIDSWYWDLGDGNFATTQNVTHTYAAPGVYDVTLTVTDIEGCSSDVTHQVTVVQTPEVEVTISPNPGCLESNITFSATGEDPIASYYWDFGDGAYAYGQTVVHQYGAEGQYEVTLEIEDIYGGHNEYSFTVVIHPPPTAFFDNSEPTCLGDSVYFIDLSHTDFGYIQRWVWNYGDGSANDTINWPDDPNTYHGFTMEGTYTVTLEIMSSDSCTDTYSREVAIEPSPVANFQFTGACDGEVVEFTDASSPGGQGNIISWQWNFGDPLSGSANNSTEQNPDHLFSGAGSYDVRLIVTNFNDCSDTIIKQVFVNELPPVEFSWDISCQDQPVEFSPDSSVMNLSTITSWLWDFGDGQSSTLEAPEHQYAVAGVYTVTLTVQDTGVCENAISHDVTVHPLPVANFSFDAPICQDGEAQFTDLSSTASGYITQWVWDYGDGTGDTINFPENPNPVHVYDTSGTFTVHLWVITTDSCEAEVEKTITVDAAPLADWQHEGGCADEMVQFTDLSTAVGAPISEWYWDFGDPVSGQNNYSSAQNPQHLFSAPGTFTVTLIVVNTSGCSDTLAQDVSVTPLPAVGFNVFTGACLGSETQFHVDSTLMDLDAIEIYMWDFGDGSGPIYQINPTHTYQLTGTYDVTLTVTDTAGCENLTTQQVEIVPPPTAAFDYTNACQNDSTQFTDYSFSGGDEPIIEWLWDFGDGATSILQNPEHGYSATGDYQVKLVVTDQGGCTDSLTRTITVYQRPVASYNYIVNACQDGLVYFTDSSYGHLTNIQSWHWTFAPGYYSDLRNPSHDFFETDTCYAVTLEVTDARGCSDTITDTVCIPAALEFDFDFTNACYGQITEFYPYMIAPEGDTLVEYHWNFGEPESGASNTSILPNPTHEYMEPGSYTVSLEAMDQQGCWQTIYRQVDVGFLPEVDFGWESFICDSSVYFEDLSSGNGKPIEYWVWDYGDGTPADTIFAPDDPDVSHVYALGGEYNVTLLVQNTGGCADTLSQTVFREYCINANFALLDTLLCQGFELSFSDSSIYSDIITSWEWNFGDGSDTTYADHAPVITHIYPDAGSFQVRLVIFSSVGGVDISDTLVRGVSILPTPIPAFSAEAVCLGGPSVFTDLSNPNGSQLQSWYWEFVSGQTDTTSTQRNPVYTYPEADSFLVKLLVTNKNGCYDSVIDTAVVNPLPDAMFAWDLNCAGQPTWFTDLSDSAGAPIVSYSWNFGDSLTMRDTSSLAYPYYIYDSTWTYYPSLQVVNANGCSGSFDTAIQVNPTPTAGFSFRENYDNVQGQLSFTNESDSSALRYYWYFGEEGAESEEKDPIWQFDQDNYFSESYEIFLVSYNKYDCPDTAFYDYNFLFKGLFVPNAFAPTNPSAEVREFKPKGINLASYQVVVFDSWGNILWESEELTSDGQPAEGWDGTYNGEELPMDVYLWKIRASFLDGSVWDGKSIGQVDELEQEAMGTVTLIR